MSNLLRGIQIDCPSLVQHFCTGPPLQNLSDVDDENHRGHDLNFNLKTDGTVYLASDNRSPAPAVERTNAKRNLRCSPASVLWIQIDS